MYTAEWLRKKRNELKLTREQLANLSDVSHFTIEGIEQKKYLGSNKTWEMLVLALGEDFNSEKVPQKPTSDIVKNADWLKSKRLEYNITQQELADSLAIHLRTITNIEQGKRVGSLNTWKKINAFFEKNSNKY